MSKFLFDHEPYAWTITRDHLAEEFGDSESEVGISGPSDAPDSMLAELRKGKGHVFRMYDDDGILYYTGRGIGDMDSEEACYGPLADFGEPNAGAVRIDWHGHPEWNCG